MAGTIAYECNIMNSLSQKEVTGWLWNFDKIGCTIAFDIVAYKGSEIRGSSSETQRESGYASPEILALRLRYCVMHYTHNIEK